MINKEEGISYIAYLKKDGSTSMLYTEEYVNDLKQRIDKSIEYINNCLIGYKEQYEEHTFNYYNVGYDLESILEILGGKE